MLLKPCLFVCCSSDGGAESMTVVGAPVDGPTVVPCVEAAFAAFVGIDVGVGICDGGDAIPWVRSGTSSVDCPFAGSSLNGAAEVGVTGGVGWLLHPVVNTMIPAANRANLGISRIQEEGSEKP